MFKIMGRLIETMYYETQDEVVDRLNMFMMFNQITIAQYAELMVLVDTLYNPHTENPEVDETTQEDEAFLSNIK